MSTIDVDLLAILLVLSVIAVTLLFGQDRPDYTEELQDIELQLWRIRKQLQRGIRTYPIATGVVFQFHGKRKTEMNIQDSGKVLKPSLAGVDAAGNPAPLDPASAPVWSLDDTSMGTVDADGTFTPSGKLGSVNLDVSIPAVGAQPAMAASLPVTVVAGSAVQVTISGSVADAPAPAAAPAAPGA